MIGGFSLQYIILKALRMIQPQFSSNWSRGFCFFLKNLFKVSTNQNKNCKCRPWCFVSDHNKMRIFFCKEPRKHNLGKLQVVWIWRKFQSIKTKISPPAIFLADPYEMRNFCGGTRIHYLYWLIIWICNFRLKIFITIITKNFPWQPCRLLNQDDTWNLYSDPTSLAKGYDPLYSSSPLASLVGFS